MDFNTDPSTVNQDTEKNMPPAEETAFGSIRLCTCGRVFTPYRKFQLYCSDACRVKFTKGKQTYYKKKPIIEKVCKQCGKKFMSNDSKRKYCSDTCLEQHEINRQVEKEERTCPVCGKVFLSSHWSKRYCSDDCRAIARRER